MAFFHFLNCLGLAYAPYVIVYKYSGLNEYSSVWKCVQSAIGYFLTQLVKLLLLATFFPDSDDHDEFAFLPELLKSVADVVDVIGLHVVMSNILTGTGQVRFLSGGLGWGFAHSIASRLIIFWVGARASAFSWRWIQTAFDSSSDLLLFLSMAALTWMAARNGHRGLIAVFLSAAVLHSFAYELFYSVFHITSWSLVVARFVYTALVSAGTIFTYANWGTQPMKRD
ncbi:unnamed protein product [Auanema sp. JU1783]|nr:unnamed protein product [Auanema sp. JU1783]